MVLPVTFLPLKHYRAEASASYCLKSVIALSVRLKNVAAFVDVATQLIMPKHEEES